MRGMRVLLLHGMGRSPLSLAGLARWLRRAGHETELLGYVAATQPYDAIVARVHARLADIARNGEPYVVIGHSLGGLLARAALAAGPLPHPPAHLIMLGTPNQPSAMARRFERVWPYRWFTGESGARLANAEYFATLPVPDIPYTAIAGTRGPRGRLSAFGQQANDGKVSVAETRISPLDTPTELPVRHTFMMNDPQVRRLINRVLARVAERERADLNEP